MDSVEAKRIVNVAEDWPHYEVAGYTRVIDYDAKWSREDYTRRQGKYPLLGRPPMLDQQVPRRYSLNFTAMGRNIFNNVNLAPPVGVLESPLFGKSNALAGGFFSSPSSNRSIDLQVSFNF